MKRRCRAAPFSWIPVVSSSSPPESHWVGSSSSEMWTQRIGCSAPSAPATSSRPQSATRLPTVSIGSLPDPLRRFGEHRPKHALDLLELLRVAHQRGRQLDHRVAPVVRAADQAAPEQLTREEAAQEPLRFFVVEALLGPLVLHQLDRVEEAVAANVPDDRNVAKRIEHRAE